MWDQTLLEVWLCDIILPENSGYTIQNCGWECDEKTGLKLVNNDRIYLNLE